MNKRIFLFVLLLPVIAIIPFTSAEASSGITGVMPVTVDGMTLENDGIRTIDLSYLNNTYICIDDVAEALAGSRAEFDVQLTSDKVNVVLGKSAEVESKAEAGSIDTKRIVCNLGRPEFIVDGEKKYYYVITTDAEQDNEKELYMEPYDIAMLLNIDIVISDDDSIDIDTGKVFSVDPVTLETGGFFQGVNAIVVGNASTGDIFYEYQADSTYPIASTTKLMTYLLTREHMSEIGDSYDTYVTISANAEFLSKGDDGVVPMNAGTQVTVKELMQAMLIPSSNEASLALAEYVAGSEDAFVQMMNEKANKLGMSTAEYYNCNGLPIFTEGTYAAKRQNHMSAKDMFTLAGYILATYPDITDITDTQKLTLGVLGKEIENTNAVIYNMPEATGLKTGTTTKSGACLVTSIHLGEGESAQDMVVVLLGAESNADRGRISELLARYAKAVYMGEARSYGAGDASIMNEIPSTAEGFVSLITRAARGKQ